MTIISDLACIYPLSTGLVLQKGVGIFFTEQGNKHPYLPTKFGVTWGCRMMPSALQLNSPLLDFAIVVSYWVKAVTVQRRDPKRFLAERCTVSH